MDSSGEQGKVVPLKEPARRVVALNEVSGGSGEEIHVLVCRVWDSSNSYGKYLSTDFLLSDKQGNVMHCVAWSNIAHCFVSALEDGKVYSMSNFTLRPNKEKYRICKDNPHIIQLEGNTVVRPLLDTDVSGFNRYPFRFTPIEEIAFVDHKYLVDVIASVSGVGSAKTSRTSSAYADYYLLNERGSVIRVTLWGNCCDLVVAKNRQTTGAFVAVFASMNVKEYKGECYLTSTSSTTIYTRVDVPQIVAFQRLMKDKHVASESNTEESTVVNVLRRGRDEKAAKAKGKRLAPMMFRCRVTITNIRTKNRWYYYSCSIAGCRKGISRASGSFFCESCNQPIDFPHTRYRLQLDVGDETGTIVVTLFDDISEKIVKKPATALLRASGTTQTRLSCPTILRS